MVGKFFLLAGFAAALSAQQPEVMPPSPKIDLESVGKTMAIFERAVERHDMTIIAAISTKKFQRTKMYGLLANAPESARINSAYISQIAKQRFRVGGNDELTLTFELHDDRSRFLAELLVKRESLERAVAEAAIDAAEARRQIP